VNLKILLYAVSILLGIWLIYTPTVLAEEPILDREKITPEQPVMTQPQQPQQFAPPQINNNPLSTTLTGRVAEDQYLPEDLYGTWQVVQTLISTNAPDVFKQKAVDIWILQQSGNKIRLANPETRAESYITVNQVNNNTATFTHSMAEKGIEEVEQPTITVTGDTFTGSNLYQIRKYFKNGMAAVAEGIFTIEAKKIAGPTLKIFLKSK
jgi:hypothetical protein